METPHRILRPIIALAAATLLAIDVAAQEATPPAGTTERAAAYPVSIHRGTCEDPVAQPVGATIESGVACGEIAGYAHDGALIFGVRSVDDSEVSGIAVVSQGHSLLDEALDEIDESVDLTDDSVTLTVYIVPGDDQDDPGA